MQNDYTAEAELMEKEQNFDFINSCLKMAELNSNFKSIIEIIEKTNEAAPEIEYLYLILEKAFNLIPEADCGRIVINNQDSAYFLEKVYRKNDLFLSSKNISDNAEQYYSTDIIFKRQRADKKLSIDLKIDNYFLGAVILYISPKASKSFSRESVKMVSLLEKISAFYLKTKRYQQLQEKFNQEIILSLSNLLGIHDEYTKGHNQQVAALSRELARAVNLDKAEVKKAYWTGLLHDIGKTLIPVSILNKKTPLTEKEFNEIKKHPEWAYRILKDSTELKEIAKYVLHHHEHWDGSGYPDGLVGKEIPLISQIVSLADAWDAMCSDRAYRKALSREEAINILTNNRGKQFSPLLVDVFLDNIS